MFIRSYGSSGRMPSNEQKKAMEIMFLLESKVAEMLFLPMSKAIEMLVLLVSNATEILFFLVSKEKRCCCINNVSSIKIQEGTT
jgi:hypothetical protein